MTDALNRDTVIAVYRALLGREPESDAVIDMWLGGVQTRQQLLRGVLSSAEFGADNPELVAMLGVMPEPPQPPAIASAPRLAIEWDVDGPIAARLLAMVAASWTRLGESEPHWSVLSSDSFRATAIERTRAAFYATGADDVAMIEGVLARNGMSLAQFPRAMEFGAGVGRVTRHLAPKVRALAACDISPSHLKLAEAWLAENAIANVRLIQSADPVDFGMTEPFDFWFSRIVLQHNPPPAMTRILRRMFAMLAPGGAALFQLPVYATGYAFSAERYLADTYSGREIEMHCLPQAAVFAIAYEAGCRAIEVREDGATGHPELYISNTFLFRKGAS
jgi:SAM-dependent methyltransferase